MKKSCTGASEYTANGRILPIKVSHVGDWPDRAGRAANGKSRDGGTSEHLPLCRRRRRRIGSSSSFRARYRPVITAGLLRSQRHTWSAMRPSSASHTVAAAGLTPRHIRPLNLDAPSRHLGPRRLPAAAGVVRRRIKRLRLPVSLADVTPASCRGRFASLKFS